MDEIYFVHWDNGDCSDGGHSYGLEKCKTLDEVHKLIVNLTTKNEHNYITIHDMNEITVIKGVVINHHDNPYLQDPIHRTNPDSGEGQVRQVTEASP